MSRAIILVSSERAHHFFCVQAVTMMANMKQVWQLAWAEPWKTMDDQAKEVMRKWYQEIDMMEKVASEEIAAEYEATKRRSIILLGDLTESYIETLLATFARHVDETGEVTRIISGRKPKEMGDPRDVRRSVRAWERSLPHKRRSARVTEMLQFYMPNFRMKDEEADVLDELFSKRNALTHEIILIGDLKTSEHHSATAAEITLQRVDEYFNIVGDFLLATMSALTHSEPGTSGRQ